MYLVGSNHHANYGVVMMSVLMARLEGTLIACIFFFDPSVVKILQGFWAKLKAFLGRAPPEELHAPSPIYQQEPHPSLVVTAAPPSALSLTLTADEATSDEFLHPNSVPSTG